MGTAGHATPAAAGAAPRPSRPCSWYRWCSCPCCSASWCSASSSTRGSWWTRPRRPGRARAAVAGEDGPSVRDRIAAELRDGVDPGRAAVSVVPAVASWGEPIEVTVSVDARASIPFIGSWPVPLRGVFVTRSEVTH
ncbi:MAG: hypothetical protein U0838_02405 [Chloroflexota bacterium]